MKTILIQPDVRGAEEFRDILKNSLSHFKVITSIEETNLSDIEVVIFWLEVPSFLNKLQNLKLLLCCGSGIDHFINSKDIPKHIPLIRLVDPYLKNRVSLYVLHQILEKYFPNLNPEKATEIHETIQRTKLRVGIMGLGLVGSAIAEKLLHYGFDVYGWVRTQKNRILSDVYIGDSELNLFAQKVNILVCQLPLTAETKGILNINLFNNLQDGSFLINVGRGGHLIEADMLAGIASGKLSGACIDVLEGDPILSDHPFSNISSIKLTPHIAGYIGPDTQASHACNVILNFYENKNTEGIVNYITMY